MSETNKIKVSSVLEAKASTELAEKILEELEVADPSAEKSHAILAAKPKDKDDNQDAQDSE